MSKRSDFPRRKHDAYQTPMGTPLPRWLYRASAETPPLTFAEPCCGDGNLIRMLARQGHFCGHAGDIDPSARYVKGWPPLDALEITETLICECDLIITNPPWTRQILHPLIERFASLRPTWLLFDADWMHTKQAKPYLEYCKRIESVGRVSWMENGTCGKDNVAWYFFDQRKPGYFAVPTEFVGRS